MFGKSAAIGDTDIPPAYGISWGSTHSPDHFMNADALAVVGERMLIYLGPGVLNAVKDDINQAIKASERPSENAKFQHAVTYEFPQTVDIGPLMGAQSWIAKVGKSGVSK